MSNEFDLRRLRLNPEDIRGPGIVKTSVYIYNIPFSENQKNVDEIKDELKRILDTKLYYKKGRKYREGFLEISRDRDIVKAIYARENPTKIVYVNLDNVLYQEHYALINANLIRSNVEVYNNFARIATFGGNLHLVSKLVNGVQIGMKGKISGHYLDVNTGFSQENMRKIIEKMENLKYIFIDPGDNDKFIQIIKKEGREDIVFKVYTNFRGIRLNNSPIVKNIIEERGIGIRQLQGSINLGVKLINTKIYSSGKIQFIIPSDIIPSNSSAEQVAELYYKKVLVL